MIASGNESYVLKEIKPFAVVSLTTDLATFSILLGRATLKEDAYVP